MKYNREYNKKCNKELTVLLLILAGLSGCGPWKKKSLNTHQTKKVASLNIPLSDNKNEINDESVRNFFGDQDDDIDTFVAQAEQEMKEMPSKNIVVAQAVDDLGDFSHINGSVASNKESSIIYFDFDDYAIQKDQEEAIRTIVAEANSRGDDSTVFIEGHACSSAGNAAYNFAISGNRGNAVKNKLVALGFPEHRIKVIARGSEMPAIVDNKPVEGDKLAQAPNRRVEYHLA